MRTLTSANSKLIISIPGVFPVPIPIEGYAADDAFTVDPFDMGETLMGVDGKLSGGYTPVPKKLNVVLQADSPSVDVFNAWAQAIQSARETLVAEVTVVIPSIGKTFTLTKGFLKQATMVPPNKKVLQPVNYSIEFETIQSALISNA